MSNIKIKMAKMKSETRPVTKIVDEKQIVMPNPFVADILTHKTEIPMTLTIPTENEKSTEVPLVYNTETKKITPEITEIADVTDKETKTVQQQETTQPEIINNIVYSPTQTLIDTINEMTERKELKAWIEGQNLSSEFDLRMNFNALKEKVIQYIVDQNTVEESEQ